MKIKFVLISLFWSFCLTAFATAQNSQLKILDQPKPALHEVSDPQAEAVIQKAIKNLGGEKYLNVKTQIGRGRFSVIRDGAVISFQTFTDVIVYPNKERTDFKGSGARSAQVNIGDTGWVYDGDQEAIREQTPEQIENSDAECGSVLIICCADIGKVMPS